MSVVKIRLKPHPDPNFRYHTPAISAEEAAERQRQNLASLNRKITYCLGRPAERLQWQPVEGWCVREIIDHMRERGIAEARIEGDLFSS
jgi:hypothetical protein